MCVHISVIMIQHIFGKAIDSFMCSLFMIFDNNEQVEKAMLGATENQTTSIAAECI